MKVKDLKKDKNKSIRINSKVLEVVKDKGFTLQSFIDYALDKYVLIEIKDKIKHNKDQ